MAIKAYSINVCSTNVYRQYAGTQLEIALVTQGRLSFYSRLAVPSCTVNSCIACSGAAATAAMLKIYDMQTLAVDRPTVRPRAPPPLDTL